MLIVMQKNANSVEIDAVKEKVRELGLRPHEISGTERVTIPVTGDASKINPEQLRRLSGIQDLVRVGKPYKLVSRESNPEGSVVEVGGYRIGGGHFCVMAGPCSVEGRDQLMSTAEHVHAHGAHILRGGAYKPRTSPYEFQGLKVEGLRLLAEAREETGMPIITEVKDTASLPEVVRYADALQIGARNMQNFSLLEAVGDTDLPIMLKRGLSATVHEWLMAAEYIMARGNSKVILCERGIRTFETTTRNTLDLGILPLLRTMTHLPIIVDPSHATGHALAVTPMARAAAATGVDGIMVEVHPDPARALSDGPQALTFPMFEQLMREIRPIVHLRGQTLDGHARSGVLACAPHAYQAIAG